MANKTCPKCQTKSHARVAKCPGCAHVFYETKKDKETNAVDTTTFGSWKDRKQDAVKQQQAIREEWSIREENQTTVAKPLNELIVRLRADAEEFDYTLREVDKAATKLSRRFIVTKMIGNQRYYAVFSNTTGRITGIISDPCI